MTTKELISALKRGIVKIDAMSIESIDAAQIQLAMNPGSAIAILLHALSAKDAEIAELKRQLEFLPNEP